MPDSASPSAADRSAAARAFPWYDHWARHRPDACAWAARGDRLSYEALAARIADERSRLAADGWRAGARFVHDAPPATTPWLVTLIAALDLGLQVVQPDQDWPAGDIPRHVAPLLSDEGAPPAPRAPGIWLFTSGTTDRPKPRLRSLPLLRSDVTRVRAALPDDLSARSPVSLCLLPLSHGFGLINSLLLIHAIGGTVLVADIADREGVARRLRDHPIEVLYAWPALLEALSDARLWSRAAGRLRWCVSSSLRLAPEAAERFAAVAGCPVRQQYGTTETGPLCLDRAEPPDPRTDCMGPPLDGVSLRVLDETGEPLPAGEVGELAVKLEHLSLDRTELTAEGYWRIGDRGYLDAAGRVHVLGRLRPFTDERAGLM